MTGSIVNEILNQTITLHDKIAHAPDAETLEQLERWLNYSTPLWLAVAYDWSLPRIQELNTAIGERANHLYSVEQTYLAGLRKNDKTRASTEAEIHRLKQLLPLAL